MRLRTNRTEAFTFENAIITKDSEGTTGYGWGKPFVLIGVMWSGSGKIQQEKYGVRLPMVRNIMLDGKYVERTEDSKVSYTVNGHTLTVGDGLCYRSDDKPDYIIRAIYPYDHLAVELEHL